MTAIEIHVNVRCEVARAVSLPWPESYDGRFREQILVDGEVTSVVVFYNVVQNYEGDWLAEIDSVYAADDDYDTLLFKVDMENQVCVGDFNYLNLKAEEERAYTDRNRVCGMFDLWWDSSLVKKSSDSSSSSMTFNRADR